jgi:hypothetical protein
MNTPKRNVRVEDELWERVERAAEQHGWTTSDEVRIALEDHVNALDREAASASPA